MLGTFCPNCNQEQHSEMEKIYLKQNSECYTCDKEKWEGGELTTDEFERRERLANQAEEKGESDGPDTGL